MAATSSGQGYFQPLRRHSGAARIVESDMTKLPRYYQVKNGYGFWYPSPRMREAGFLGQPCGLDGAEARAKAEALNAECDAFQQRRTASLNSINGFVYFLRSGDRVKIGFTVRLTLRGVDKGAGRNVPIQQLVAVRSSRAKADQIQADLNAYIIGDGWFRAVPPVLEALERACGPNASLPVQTRKRKSA